MWWWRLTIRRHGSETGRYNTTAEAMNQQLGIGVQKTPKTRSSDSGCFFTDYTMSTAAGDRKQIARSTSMKCPGTRQLVDGRLVSVTCRVDQWMRDS